MARAPVLLSLIALLAVSGCAVPHDTSQGLDWGQARLRLAEAGGDVKRCTEAFTTIDEAVDAAGRGDAGTAPIPGFPHLRATRFLAALGKRFLGPPKRGGDRKAFEYWTGWLASTAIKARGYELANLPGPDRAALRDRLGDKPETVIADCTAVLSAFDGRRPETRAILAKTVNVPDQYIDVERVVGLYPLTSLGVRAGYENWKDLNLPSFARAASDLQMRGKSVRFAPKGEPSPMSPAEVESLLRKSSNNPLHVPRPTGAAWRRLALSFAPVLAVDVTGDYDRIGTPMLAAHGPPRLDLRAPRLYVQPSWALFGGAPLLQISYLAWFSQRPPRGSLDILAGRMDGIIWRVTIAPDGRPMLYDSIHPCGCYHLFFPVPPTRLRDHRIDEPGEGTVVPTAAPTLGPGRRMVLHIASGSHYLRAISTSPNETLTQIRYDLVAMDSLRSLPVANGGTRSLYGPDGIVVGTERLERFVLWPMGVPSPGAMRQWGTHATAFVGRRHFDDPYLIERAFAR